MAAAVTPDDLSVYLGTSVEPDRAQMLIDDVKAQALALVTVGTVPDTGATWDNLPTGAEAIVRAAVARLYTNPTGVSSEGVGPFTYTRPAPSGSLLSTRERKALKRLAGRAGAFSVDPTPADVGADLYPWDLNQWQVDGDLLLAQEFDPDNPPGVWQ